MKESIVRLNCLHNDAFKYEVETKQTETKQASGVTNNQAKGIETEVTTKRTFKCPVCDKLIKL